MADADGASKFSDLSRLQIALEDLNGKKVGEKKIWRFFLISTISIFVWRTILLLLEAHVLFFLFFLGKQSCNSLWLSISSSRWSSRRSENFFPCSPETHYHSFTLYRCDFALKVSRSTCKAVGKELLPLNLLRAALTSA